MGFNSYDQGIRLPLIAGADPDTEGDDGHVHFQHLKRQLGFWQLTMLGVGGSIGAGVFSLTGVAAAGAGPAVVFSYIFSGIIAAIDALCYSEMASRYPQAGTVFLYTHVTFGELPALLVSINLLVDYTVAAALISRSFALYLVDFLKHAGLGPVPAWLAPVPVTELFSLSLVAPLLLLLHTLVLCRGTETGAVLNAILTSAKVAVILLVCALGLFHVQPRHWLPFFPRGLEAVFRTSSTVFFSYVGFDTIASSSEECQDPLRDMPRAILVSLATCVGIYCAVCLVLTGMVPFDAIDLAAPLSSAFAGLGLAWVQAVISLGGVVGLATTLLIGLFAQARIWLGIARDGLLPAALARIHPRFKTPVNAQALCGFLPMALAAFFNVRLLSELLDIGVILAYGTVCAALLLQRSTRRVYTTRCLVALLPACALPLSLHKYKASTGILALDTAIWLSPLFVLVPLLRPGDYLAPPPGVCFACPAVPYVPVAGVVLNVYLAVNLPAVAWARLFILWTGILLYYVWTEYGYFLRGDDRRDVGARRTRKERPKDVTENGKGPLSPTDSLRRRHGGMGEFGKGQQLGRWGEGLDGKKGENLLRKPLLDGEDIV